MRQETNECVGCPQGVPCIGDSCPYLHIIRWYCDECGAEETLYYVDGRELCGDCALETLEVVEGSDD